MNERVEVKWPFDGVERGTVVDEELGWDSQGRRVRWQFVVYDNSWLNTNGAAQKVHPRYVRYLNALERMAEIE